jgi:hypothetical protein
MSGGCCLVRNAGRDEADGDLLDEQDFLLLD